ncbi:diaminopimelate epimerase [Synechococcus sp. BS55D]|uniref:diaminopimelate epimerase n=1 Tax=Synechococcus sp. BS55D TaxID=2055943 RepID=UPI001039E509|nr:diaminopimelate epimerase [Synechococcus sp. BS55D]TCD57230.1 diaminopimelate epimerase [Synechococcus sp. BS55D]
MLQFSKYQGLGNDFVVLEGRAGQLDASIRNPDAAWIRRICDRRFGIGADGIILALPPETDGDLRMRIFNADGSEAEMCGNGIRCLARFLADSDGSQSGERWRIETAAGMIVPELQADGQIKVDMGLPFLIPDEVPTSLPVGSAGLPQGELDVAGVTLSVAAAGMGNPHVVVPVEDLKTIPFETWGAALEVHDAFPAKTNVHFLQVHGPQSLEIRVWERGAGPTLACGTGACATLVCAHLLGLADHSAQVNLPGGPLLISWPDRRGSIFMTGPAEAVFDGVLVPELVPTPVAALTPEPQAANHRADNDTPSSIEAEFNCATACQETCQKPDHCLRAEAQRQVQALLETMSLDTMITLAGDSLEQRTRARVDRETSG